MCNNCPQSGQFSWFFDRSEYLYNKKKSVIEGTDLTIITPSQWLAGLVKESFFKDYPVKVINNGIDLSVFNPTESNFREKYQIGDKYVVLGVAFGWGARKGLDVFIELSKRLPENYQIVLVGTDDNVDKQLPGNIISILKYCLEIQKNGKEFYSEKCRLFAKSRFDKKVLTEETLDLYKELLK